MKEILQALNLSADNIVTCLGPKQWIDNDKADRIESISPASNEVIACVQCTTNEDYDAVIANAKHAQIAWAKVPAPQRGEVVRRIGNALRDKKAALGSLVALEMGKIKQEGDGEVQEMIDMADLAVGQSRMLYGQTMHSERPMHRMYEQWHPLGVVGVISAFNFPVAVWAWNAFIAAICGNTVVWKPSAKTALCAIAVQHICNDVMQEMGYSGIFSLFLPADHNISARFIADRRVALMSFTGSSQVGHFVAKTVAGRMGRYLLECSGNNAIIVDETADLDLAIPAIVFGAVGTTGQRCTTTRRLFAQRHIYDELLSRLKNAYAQVVVGNPLDSSTLMGPLIDEAAVQTYELAIEKATSEGGNVLLGGKRKSGTGFFVEPTLIEVQHQSEIVCDETFAPILYILKYQDLAQAIEMQNAVPQGLSSAFFTNNVSNAETFLSVQGSDCGIANINIGTSGAEIGGAFGGEKETGGGREAGSDSWKAYMRRQTNTINWGSDLPLAQGIQFDLGK